MPALRTRANDELLRRPTRRKFSGPYVYPTSDCDGPITDGGDEGRRLRRRGRISIDPEHANSHSSSNEEPQSFESASGTASELDTTTTTTTLEPQTDEFTGVTISGVALRPTVAFDTFWRFAAERKSIDDKRRAGEPSPWTNDEILQKYFFCNTFRVLDKGCQFLIREVIERGSQTPEEVVFRVILFNLFTKIDTWRLLDRALGPLTWATYSHKAYARVLSKASMRGTALYTEAFIKPAPHFGHKRNFENHLCFLEVLMENKITSRLLVAPYMADVYEYLYSFPSVGSFSAYQLMLSFSYTKVLNFHRNDFVVSGPGSISGLAKMFRTSSKSFKKDLVFHQDVMKYLVNSQGEHFRRLGLKFSGLGPKCLPMDVADIEHTLCEVDKYCRIAHPQLRGARKTITRHFTPHLKLATINPAILPKAWHHPARQVPRIRLEKGLRHEKRYEISSIKDHRDLDDGSRQFLVYWVGYADKEASWEYEISLLDEAPMAVKAYLENRNTI